MPDLSHTSLFNLPLYNLFPPRIDLIRHEDYSKMHELEVQGTFAEKKALPGTHHTEVRIAYIHPF